MKNSSYVLVFALLVCMPVRGLGQNSVARQWNEALLEAIRHDLARPTVQARNLFHFAIASYDAWAAYDSVAETFLLGKTVGGYSLSFAGIAHPADIHAARDEAISFAAHRLLKNRYKNSPAAATSLALFDSLLTVLGYDTSFTSTDYSSGSPAALGNYIGQGIIDFGLQDGSNEQNNYAYQHYQPVNPPLVVADSGNQTILDANRWQALKLSQYIDQNGTVYPANTQKCVTPEWGAVTPFALTEADRSSHLRDGYSYTVYHDPGPPPLLDTLNGLDTASVAFKWAYTLVNIWSSHLNGSDSVLWDISPASIGNIPALPTTFAELRGFYKLQEGGDIGTGRTVNPKTGLPYTPQLVPRGDYTRVLAEFWADGPNSETPPGHWFTILNYVTDQPLFEKRFKGQGPVLDALEWDVKAYFALGGAVHDAAISAWGIKGWYDTVRPISAIRWMSDRGQCSDSTLPRYDRLGIPLIPGFIELVQPGDPLAGTLNENVNKIKVYAWRGTSYIINPANTIAGVGWILAGKWLPYQRPTFVTPPFPGYVSGHSTYSRAAAEVMTLLTGDEFFPGGMGEFFARKNEFLTFEDGPSIDLTLQWATYRDAADQCSLSRIWGGIHPPIDDIPGRLIGQKVGINAFALAEKYFTGMSVSDVSENRRTPARYALTQNYPNPFNPSTRVEYQIPATSNVRLAIYDVLGQVVAVLVDGVEGAGNKSITWNASNVPSGVYFCRIDATSLGNSSERFTRMNKMILIR